MHHLFWTANTGTIGSADFKIFYKRTTDLGLTWQPDVRVTDHTMMDSLPSLSCAALGSAVCLAWVDRQNGIYYKYSMDNGMT
ncbi:MAG: hypothetical protein WBB37_08245 [bacterium]